MRTAGPRGNHGFVTTIRALTDRLGREEYLAPDKPQPVVAHAHEIGGLLGRSSPSELGVVGHFLEQEGTGVVQWSDDPSSAWRIEIDHRIRAYAGVASIYDYLRIRYPDAE